MAYHEFLRRLDQPREGDTIFVWSLDHLCRSPEDVRHIMVLISKGIKIIVCADEGE